MQNFVHCITRKHVGYTVLNEVSYIQMASLFTDVFFFAFISNSISPTLFISTYDVPRSLSLQDTLTYFYKSMVYVLKLYCFA